MKYTWNCKCGCGGKLTLSGSTTPLLYFTNNILQDAGRSVKVDHVSLDGFINDEWSVSPTLLKVARDYMEGKL